MGKRYDKTFYMAVVHLASEPENTQTWVLHDLGIEHVIAADICDFDSDPHFDLDAPYPQVLSLQPISKRPITTNLRTGDPPWA